MELDHQARLATLAALDATENLRDHYALKGGLVLRHVYGSPRVSEDLDFNHVGAFPNSVNEEHRAVLDDFCGRLAEGLARMAPAYGLTRAAVRVEKWSTVLPTVFAHVVYEAEDSEGTVEMQVTLSEAVCRTARARVGGVPVLASALEDTVADKLKVLIQQVPRHQVRHSDVFDLWFALERATLVPDPAVVATCLHQKTAMWPDLLPLSSARFRDDAVRTFAEAGYRALRAEQPDLPFAPFDVVWARIQALVDALGLEA